MLTKKMCLTGLFIFFLFVQYTAAQETGLKHSKKNETSVNIFKDKNGIAIEGYDPVAYFTDKKPTKGKPEFTYKYKDAVWHFESTKHLIMFKKNPEKYMPQYGGFCAYGISHKAGLVKTDPTAWEVVNGKLYLNLNVKYNKLWNKHSREYINAGNAAWSKLKNTRKKHQDISSNKTKRK